MIGNIDIIERMQEQVDHWKAAGDARAIFLECYTLMTGNMLRAIDDGRFHDNRWARSLLLRFAEYYFQALESYDCRDEACATVWTFAHDCSCRRQLHVLQHLLLGINAHINYDLVLSLADLLEPEWDGLPAAKRQLRYEDHCRVNEIIAATIDTVQDEVVEHHDPRMDLIDRLMGRLDERLLSGLINRWREEVWEKAMLLLATPAEDRDAFQQELADAVMKKARWIVI